jgi:hypothetical protein
MSYQAGGTRWVRHTCGQVFWEEHATTRRPSNVIDFQNPKKGLTFAETVWRAKPDGLPLRACPKCGAEIHPRALKTVPDPDRPAEPTA